MIVPVPQIARIFRRTLAQAEAQRPHGQVYVGLDGMAEFIHKELWYRVGLFHFAIDIHWFLQQKVVETDHISSSLNPTTTIGIDGLPVVFQNGILLALSVHQSSFRILQL